ncbi:hypothetical protein DUNSADRAFT_1154 [Dunaliella salina]|uniref:Uncharacterized protein n=1 Tax=Dunaliella salina TaxID=3046 RepID=A0ABQ7GXF2_DUNSA|nr:hypothetical protein DUNSADRAFT_1154 [Dunaliella salina]|eukprot:KAF5839281.1 hypothetical protein DUNSADRAFT_1154 [Dunaliella salina]
MAIFPQGKAEEALQLVTHAAEQQVHVLHTNKAEVSSPLASQIAQFAGWPSSVVQSLAGVCYGVELSGEESLEQPLQAKAESLGGHCTSNTDAAELFRHLGIEG